MSSPLPYPRWRKLLSYLADQTLEEGGSDHTEHVRVLLRRGRLVLQANGAIYSYEDNYYNFRTAFEVLDWEALPGTDALLLGLGLGSVPQMIEERFGRTLNYVALEYDETIAALAERYLLYRLRSPIEVVVADAAAFAVVDTRTYDLILVDLFVDDAIPEAFTSEAYLRSLAERLRPGGCLVSNRLTFTEADRAVSEAYYRDTFREVFPRAGYLDVESNWMLVSDARFLA